LLSAHWLVLAVLWSAGGRLNGLHQGYGFQHLLARNKPDCTPPWWHRQVTLFNAGRKPSGFTRRIFDGAAHPGYLVIYGLVRLLSFATDPPLRNL
jgi:hypothetical protein